MKVLQITVAVGLLCMACIAVVGAEENDLSSAVFIAHFPPDFVYSEGENWVAKYYSDYQITELGEVNPSIPDGVYQNSSNQAVWYIIAAFCDGEDKVWGGVQFGFGDYDANSFYITDSSPCLQDALEIPSGGWPGPEEGVAIAWSGSIYWSGNFEPLYYFQGYQYSGTTVIQITGYEHNGHWAEPALGNLLIPAESFLIIDENRLGAMGVGVAGEGVDCGGVSGVDEMSWGQIKLLHK